MIARYRHWVFDLDGTLTLATHDFDAIRAELGLPGDVGILEALARLPEADARPLHDRLAAWELEHARFATAAPDALPLLDALRQCGAILGILTRNRLDVALETLRGAGLADRFVPSLCLSRDCAPAKPSGAGLRRLAAQWGVAPSELVMVGDYRYDLEAAHDAGAVAVLIDRDGAAGEWARLAHHRVSSLDQLLSVTA
jgi:HAD superfamily hydrolase (TIGR01509 family)